MLEIMQKICGPRGEVVEIYVVEIVLDDLRGDNWARYMNVSFWVESVLKHCFCKREGYVGEFRHHDIVGYIWKFRGGP